MLIAPRNDGTPFVIANAVKQSVERLPRADALAMTENVKRLLRHFAPRNVGRGAGMTEKKREGTKEEIDRK